MAQAILKGLGPGASLDSEALYRAIAPFHFTIPAQRAIASSVSQQASSGQTS
ncbi:hypothetical protein [Phaeobacter sp. CECT 5382]|uniref:hypothetical protein n=1 Tax=Phaeobacter sp. CECT 5382 TaxID=1712645 RepID=UPI000A5EE73D|nr:hypothetical protein [Phaeobacter sp. CECT 5382]